ncbi:hypothetical protein Gotur_013238 [Gossypium turneri]
MVEYVASTAVESVKNQVKEYASVISHHLISITFSVMERLLKISRINKRNLN